MAQFKTIVNSDEIYRLGWVEGRLDSGIVSDSETNQKYEDEGQHKHLQIKNFPRRKMESL